MTLYLFRDIPAPKFFWELDVYKFINRESFSNPKAGKRCSLDQYHVIRWGGLVHCYLLTGGQLDQYPTCRKYYIICNGKQQYPQLQDCSRGSELQKKRVDKSCRDFSTPCTVSSKSCKRQSHHSDIAERCLRTVSISGWSRTLLLWITET